MFSANSLGKRKYMQGASTLHEESVKEAELLKRSLETIQTLHPQEFCFLEVAIDEVLADCYSQEVLELLGWPIKKPEELPKQDEASDLPQLTSLVNIANRHRTRLLDLCRSVLTAAEAEKTDGLVDDLQNALQDAEEALSPSEAAKHSNLAVEQEKRPMKIGRPYETTGLPVSLYHPIFSRFQRLILDQDPDLSAKDLSTAFQLIYDAAAVYKTEADRLSAMISHFNALLGHEMYRVTAPYSSAPDGVIFHSNTPLLVMEATNEVGTDESDPDLQGAFSYRKGWTGTSNSEILNVCCCPGFVLSVAGPRITIFGAVLVENFIVQPLTETLGLAGFHDPSGRARYIAKIMVALRTCLEELKVFYDGLTPAAHPQPTRFWPHFRKYSNFTISYTSHNLIPGHIGRAMFDVVVTGPNEDQRTPAKVKFTPQYCYVAHALLAEKQLAPQLLHFEKLENGWTVVVMATIPGPNLESAKLNPVPPRVLSDIKEALVLLHGANLVFGDLRRPNIMLCEREQSRGGTEQGAMLVDFDWAGEEGKARYPLSLNTEIPWPEGVENAGFLRKEHDDGMFGLLS
ncbi:hypothetical protein FRC01_000985 [Tulasnella sp. 417]|nr:hypothetical protein FRC01_000985 [Tulasnella sp. 417]